MSDLKSFCPRCKKNVDFTVVGEFMTGIATCPECAGNFALDLVKPRAPKNDQGGGLGRTLLTIFLALLALFLVLLAFIFAACSQGLRNI
jgi:hypothetical protein